MQQPANACPEWVTIELLRKAVRSYKNDDTFEVNDFSVKSGFSEHFASVMLQCKIDCKSVNTERETLNVVVKARQIIEGLKAIACEEAMFENEIRMYTSTLPAFNRLFARFGMNIDLAPEFIYATNDPFPIIILKDLTIDGYFAPRTSFEDLEDAKQVIQRIAQFHAASFYLSGTNQMDFHDYKFTAYENEDIFYKLYNTSVNVFKEVLETWDGYQEFIPKIERYMEQIGEIGRKSHSINKANYGYNVLNHGDFHTRNLLVKLNSKQNLQQFCLIDYQLSIYCSPAIDLNYAASMLSRDENGDIPYDDVIVFYHQEFVKTLNTFGYTEPIPSLIDLNVELIRHGRTNVLMLIIFVPYGYIDWTTTRMEDFMGTNENDEKAKMFKKSLYNQPICKAIMQRTLKSFLHKGWL
ncbi:uncharacterized protein LOC119069927 [Bradysia coprophila]|uniref:uncharacterized protein LOC119069927 n=1 Tax=Bradysia coprophila TaxID=38358 RepID=UPI00187D779F|nr:uncharacterized protein LOC119069927 [Bradysia coprophila]